MRFKHLVLMVGAGLALAALVSEGKKIEGVWNRSSHGVAPRSGFVMADADRRKSRAYLDFMYGLLYQERGQRNEAAERFAEACALDRVLQPGFESDLNPS